MIQKIVIKIVASKIGAYVAQRKGLRRILMLVGAGAVGVAMIGEGNYEQGITKIVEIVEHIILDPSIADSVAL